MAVNVIVAFAAKYVVKKYGKRQTANFVRKECVNYLKELLRLDVKDGYLKSLMNKAIRWLESASDDQIMILIDPIGGFIEKAGGTVVRTASNIGKNPSSLLQSGFSSQNSIQAGQAVKQGVPFGTLLLRPF